MTELADTTKTFPYQRQCPFTPPAEYETYTEHPVQMVTLPTGLRVWTVAGLDNVRALLTDRRVSASRKHDNFPFYFDAPPEFRTETSFIGYDAPDHSRTRGKAAVTFTARRVKLLRPRIEEIVDDTLDRMLALEPPVDMHHHFSLEVPMTVICELLGIPQDQHAFFVKHGTALLGGHSSEAERKAAIVEVNEYLFSLVASKEVTPGDDLISRAIQQYRDAGETYEHIDIVNMCRLLMNGGHETTASMISLGTAYLLEHPEDLQLMLDDPSKVPAVVEELVRLLAIGDTAIPRVALEDIEIAGVTIPAGDGILCLGLATNRDAAQYPSPNAIDVTTASRQHLGFGHGVHHCIGADLARTEMEIVWAKLFQRIPSLKLAQHFSDVRSKEGAVIYGLWELPVTW
jgi:cytochrome P450